MQNLANTHNTFSYEISWTDEELQQAIDEEGFYDICTPNDVKKYLYDEIYKLYKNAMEANNENNY